MGKGYKGYIGVAEESVWGTPVVTGMDFCEFTSEGIKTTKEEILSKGVNSGRAVKRRFDGTSKTEGPFTFEVNGDDVIGQILKHTLFAAAAPSQQGATAAYLHAFTDGDTPPVGMTVQLGRDLAVFNCSGGKINTLKLKAAINEILTAEVGLIFKDEVVGTSQTPSYSTANPFVYHQGVLTVDGTPVDIQGFELEMNNQVKGGRYNMSSPLTLEPREGKILVKGSFKQFFPGAGVGSAYAKFRASNTPAALILTFTGAIIASTYAYKLTITLPEVYYGGETPNIGGPDADIEQNIPFTAIYNTAAAYTIKVELVNTHTAQY